MIQINFILLLFIFTIADAGSPRSSESVRSVKFSYSVSLKEIPAKANEVSIFVPLPQSDKRQTIENLVINSQLPYEIRKEKEYGNSVLHILVPKTQFDKVVLSIKFNAKRSGYSKLQAIEASEIEKLSPEIKRRFLLPDKLVPLDGPIANEAKKIIRSDMTVMQKARTIYDHITNVMKYDKSGTGWGRGDAIYACDAKKGNCTDFHSLFVALARASGIPARFVIGFPLPTDKMQGEISGYHCWAEFFADGIGWIPVDASEAVKNPEKKEFFFGGLDENRIQFSIGRDIRLDDSSNIEPVNYFIYPFVLVDGKPFENIERHISFTEGQKY